MYGKSGIAFQNKSSCHRYFQTSRERIKACQVKLRTVLRFTVIGETFLNANKLVNHLVPLRTVLVVPAARSVFSSLDIKSSDFKYGGKG